MGADDRKALVRDDAVDARRERGSAITNVPTSRHGAILDVPTQVTGLWGDPRGGRMLRAAGQMDAACAQLDEEKQ